MFSATWSAAYFCMALAIISTGFPIGLFGLVLDLNIDSHFTPGFLFHLFEQPFASSFVMPEIFSKRSICS